MYTIPELKTLPTNSVNAAPEFKPELTVVDLGSCKTTRYLNLYRLCYLDRLSINPDIRSIKERKKVNLSSLCAKRSTLIQQITRGFLEEHIGIPHFNSIEYVFDWIDRQSRSGELYSPNDARRLYREYTDHLRHRLRLSNVGDAAQSFGHVAAQKKQLAFTYVCSLACELDPKAVQSWALQIPQRKAGLNELPAPETTSEEHALANALHKRFFEAFSQAVLNDTTPPVVVKLTDLGFEDFIFYSNIANNAGGWSTKIKGKEASWQPLFYRSEGVFEGTHTAFNALLAEHSIAPVDSWAFKCLQNRNRHFSQGSLRELANHATRHFGYLLLAEAGSNAAHLASINCNSVKLDKAMGLASTRAIKGRAGFEDQEQFVDIRFAQKTWKQYLSLRNWMTKSLENPPEVGLFLLSRRPDKEPFNYLLAASLQHLPHWPSNAPSLATRAARKHKSANLLEGSLGNTSLVSGMQYMTASTIERHYNFKNREEAVELMSLYFTSKALSAQLRYQGIEPIRILVNGDETHAGLCDADTNGPKLLEGLEDIDIEPRCGAPITCIFCAHFGLHADSEDMLRLLTIKLWIETQSRINSISIDDHFQKFLPYINRIQQVLDQLSIMNNEISQHLKHAFARFELGERDQYWNAKINALLEMENI